MINKDIISIDQLSKADIEEIFRRASRMENDVKNNIYPDKLRHKVMASLFFEPSTRTRFSFEAAMLRLGGSVISTTGFVFSSISKGETLADTIKTIERYCDVVVIRHPEVGSAKIAADSANIPVINAGDGPGEHPTQALLDLYTIRKEKNGTSGINIALVGDLKNGRTVHSLIKLLVKFGDVKIQLISPKELCVPLESIELMEKSGIKYTESDNLAEAISSCDVLYMTRIQKERFASEKEYEKHKGCFVLDKKMMKNAKKDMIIMHPLPRVDEISTEIDNDPRAKYFDQVENGMYVRMALLAIVLKIS